MTEPSPGSQSFTLDPELVELVKDYHANNRPTLLNLFRKYPEKQIITFHTRDEAVEWRKKQECGSWAPPQRPAC